MLTMHDCLDFCGLREDEILAVAEHEHVPEIIALEIASALSASQVGRLRLCRMIEENALAAEDRGDCELARQMREVLKHYLENHTTPPAVH